MRAELLVLGFRHDTANILAQLFTNRGGVPQGSPVSGDALNLFFWRLDQLLSSMAGTENLRFSRVADDFVLSGNSRANGDRVAARIEDELARREIQINQKKKLRAGLLTPSDERVVHSIKVSKPRGTAVRREHVDKALTLAKVYIASCRSVTPESLQAVAAKRQELAGWMYYCRQADLGPARAIRECLAAGDRHVLRKLTEAKISSPKNKWWLVNRAHRKDEPKRIAAIWAKRFSGQSYEPNQRSRTTLAMAND
jgi:hypothetical protein